jgi:aminoglycoside 2''-phosphotransferase
MEQVDPLLYKQAIEACFPQVHVRSWVPIEEGWSSFILEVNGETIFRFPRRPDILPGLRREMALLPDLAPALSVAVPQYEYVWPGVEDGAGACRWPFVGYRKIAGLPLDAALLGSVPAQALAASLAAAVTELHCFPVARAAELGVPGGSAADWRREYRETYGWVQRLVCPLLEEAVLARMTALWEGFLEHEANFRFRPALVHRDLCGDHILCVPAAGRVNGIIDWEDAAIGDPAIDFVGVLWACGPEFTAQVLAAYRGPVDETFWSRVVFYRRIVPAYEIQFGLETGQPLHVAQGLADLRKDFGGAR